MHPEVYEAAKSGDFDSLMTIISANGEDLHQTTPKGSNILHVAAQHQQVNFITQFLQDPSRSSLLWQGNCKQDTPLHVAAKVGSYKAVQAFTDLAKSLDQPDACKELLRRLNMHKESVLHYAVRGGHYWVVKLLIEEDPQLCDITNVADESPLYVAAHRRFSDIIELILSASSLSSSQSHSGPKGLTALHAATIYSVPTLTEQIPCCIEKKLPLNKLCWTRILEERPELIKEGDDMGWTPLHYVACCGEHESVRVLLQHDTSVAYVVDKEGQSALHIAAFQGHVNVIDEILRYCPDAFDIINSRGQTALHAAVIGEEVKVVKHILGMPYLEDLFNEQDTDGNTALHLAALLKLNNIIYMLARDKRVDRLAMNKDHLTALDIFYAHKEEGYKAAKVEHVLINSRGSQGFQGWVMENVKKRLDKKYVEGQPVVSLTPESTPVHQENLDLSVKSNIEAQLLVAVLMAAVTFAATFTMPGGYNNDGPNQGMATLAGRTAFQAFVVSNTIAFSLSMLALFLQYDSSVSSDGHPRYAPVAGLCIYIAMLGMLVAFTCGTYVVLTEIIGLAIIPFVVSGCLLIMTFMGLFLKGFVEGFLIGMARTGTGPIKPKPGPSIGSGKLRA